MKKKQLIVLLLIVAMLSSILPVPRTKASDSGSGTNAMITHYTMVKKGSRLTDVTGNGHDATLVGFKDSDIIQEDSETRALSFTGDSSKYVKLPAGTFGDDETFTIEATFNTSTAANHWLYCLGTKEGKWPDVKNYVFLNPIQGGGTIRAGIKDSSSELTSQTGSINTGTYNTITTVFSDGLIDIYLNGAPVGKITHSYSVQSILAEGVADAADCIGYIGKSLYSPDPAFTGKLKDFKVYNYSLTAGEVAEKANQKLITHYTMAVGDNALLDTTGNGHDAPFVGFTGADFIDDNGSTVLNFTGDNSKYIAIPDSAVGDDETFTIETTFNTSTEANHWLYCLGAQVDVWPNVKNYVFLNPLQGGGSIRSGIKDSNAELLTQDGAINTAAYNTITTVFNEGKITLYINGTMTGTVPHTYNVQDIITVASGSAITAGGPSVIGYIGKSLYSPDPAFTGKLKDFKVYNYALTAEEIKGKTYTGGLSDAETIALAKEALIIPNADDIRGNITLPTTSEEGAIITWHSSDESVISVNEAMNTGYDNTPAGVVTRQAADTKVTLTATITSGSESDTKSIEVTVIKKPVEIQESDYTDY